jgi:hypothetical protein
VLTLANCTARQGIWRGPHTMCGLASCPTSTPTGACCVRNATDPTGVVCVVLTEAQCAERQGTWRGAGTVCGTGVARIAS